MSGTGIFGTRVGIGTTALVDPLTIAATGYGVVHRSGATEIGTFADGTAGWLGTRSAHPLRFFTGNGASRLTIDIGGSVGVGTNTPGSLFHVNGTAQLGGLFMPSGAGAGKVLTSDASGNATWQNPNGGLVLPYSGQVSALGHAFKVVNTDPTGSGSVGLSGESHSNQVGIGVFGQAAAVSGTGFGIRGLTNSPEGAGVHGISLFGASAPGVRGDANATDGIGVLGTANLGSVAIGVWGLAVDGTGVIGEGSTAVRARGTNYGVIAEGDDRAIIGITDGANGIGVYGDGSGGSAGSSVGVMGFTDSDSGYAVFANGKFAASGTKSFHIDHPIDPENKYLNHYCTEGADPLNVYRGTVTLDSNGSATVTLPDYFESINRDPSYQLTAVGRPAPNLYVAREVHNGRFVIAGGTPGQRVSWRVEAIRNDRFVQCYGAPVEQAKPEIFRGTYLQPELYGRPQQLRERYRPPNSITPRRLSRP